MKNFIKKIFSIINKTIFILVVAIIMVFCLNNNQIVKTSLSPLPFEIETRLFIVILLCFFGGILVGFLCSSVSLTKERFKNFVSGWKIKLLKKKVEKNKILPANTHTTSDSRHQNLHSDDE